MNRILSFSVLVIKLWLDERPCVDEGFCFLKSGNERISNAVISGLSSVNQFETVFFS